jgi:copper chaperone CopZ
MKKQSEREWREKLISCAIYNIEGMDCSSCTLTIENHLKDIPSVKNVSVNFSTGKMT